jgi:hypothetical protein
MGMEVFLLALKDRSIPGKIVTMYFLSDKVIFMIGSTIT